MLKISPDLFISDTETGQYMVVQGFHAEVDTEEGIKKREENNTRKTKQKQIILIIIKL